MISAFPPAAIEAAKQHALKEHPKESCGLIVGNKYYRCKNVAADPTTDFRIDEKEVVTKLKRGNIKCVIHSHNNWAHCSAKDQAIQMASGFPFGIINIFNNRVDDVWFWGDEVEPDPMVGRKFRNGSHDCYSLVRDWYRVNRDVLLPTKAHPLTWFRDKKDEEGNIIRPATDMIVDNIKEFGFKEVSANGPFEIGDVLMARDNSKVINHTAIYVGNGYMLHHMWNRLSTKVPLINWIKYVEKVARYVEKS
jgi:proteasome lid subunit RPN8/RPN11